MSPFKAGNDWGEESFSGGVLQTLSGEVANATIKGEVAEQRADRASDEHTRDLR